jgi:hypothetical protein
MDGLRRTIDWYFETKDVDEVRAILDRGGLTERAPAPEARGEPATGAEVVI